MRSFAGKLFSFVLWVLLACLAGYVGYTYYENQPCKNPIEYKVGTIDPRFGVSKAQFLADISQAGSLWSTAEGKTLFEYNPDGKLTINLVYDDRQKLTQQEQSLTSSIDSTKGVADSVKQQYTALQTSYNTASNGYSATLAQFNQAQSDYNAQVAYYNSHGGAPQKEYAALQAQKAALDSQRVSLEAERQQVNDLANQINALIDKYNLLVDHINATVDAINNDGLTGTQFEEGVYISDSAGTRINIYQFNNQSYFLRVLAHEMGHSLGLGHNNGADSIMNPVNQSKNFALSAEDLEALQAECRK